MVSPSSMPVSMRQCGLAGGCAKRRNATDGGQEAAPRVLAVDAGLDRVAALADRILGQRQALAGGDAELPFHQVESGDGLRHRVLDLQARVHLHEEELRRPAATMNSIVPAFT